MRHRGTARGMERAVLSTWRALSALRPRVHASSLGLYRILFSSVLLIQLDSWSTRFDLLRETHVQLAYPGLRWIPPISTDSGYLVQSLATCSGLMLAAGLCTRLAAATAFITFGYLMSQDVSDFSHHNLLIFQILGAGMVVKWGEWGSIDQAMRTRSRRKLLASPNLQRTLPASANEPMVPCVHLIVCQLLTFAPCVFSALTKLNSDWLLHAQPLAASAFPDLRIPHQEAYLRTLALFSLAYDAAILPLLMWRATRLSVGVPACGLAIMAQHYLMPGDGMWMLWLVGLVLFLDPQLPEHIWNRLAGQQRHGPLPPQRTLKKAKCSMKHRPDRAAVEGCDTPLCRSSGLNVQAGGMGHRRGSSFSLHQAGGEELAVAVDGGDATPPASQPPGVFSTCRSAAPPAAPPGHASAPRVPGRSTQPPARPLALWQRMASLAGCLLYICFSMRYWMIYRGDVAWHEEGFISSWAMKSQKQGYLYMVAEDAHGEVVEFAPEMDVFLLPMQQAQVARSPHSMLQYVDRMQRIFASSGRHLQSVRAVSCVSVNHRAPRTLYVPTANLLAFVGRYDRIGTTGLGAFVNDWHKASPCDMGAWHSNWALRRRLEQNTMAAHAAAGLERRVEHAFADGPDDEGDAAYTLVHVDRRGAGDATPQLAYLWQPALEQVIHHVDQRRELLRNPPIVVAKLAKTQSKNDSGRLR